MKYVQVKCLDQEVHAIIFLEFCVWGISSKSTKYAAPFCFYEGQYSFKRFWYKQVWVLQTETFNKIYRSYLSS